jgi:hypothetical protein
MAATTVFWAALSGIGASFLATAVIFTLLLPVTFVEFAPLSRERAFELSGLAGGAAAILVARVAGGWRAVAIVGLCLGAAVCYAIWRSTLAFDFCLRARCPMGDYATSQLDAVIRQWPAAAGAALGLLTSLRTWAAREGTNALLEATGALALSTGLVAVVFGFDDARAGPIIVLGEATAPMYIALFIGSLAAAAIVVGIRSATPLLSGVRFVAVAIALEAPLVVQEAFQRGPRELKWPVLAVAIPLAAALGSALVGASFARVLRSLRSGQPSARDA